jgi:hypothetical protein
LAVSGVILALVAVIIALGVVIHNLKNSSYAICDEEKGKCSGSPSRTQVAAPTAAITETPTGAPTTVVLTPAVPTEEKVIVDVFDATGGPTAAPMATPNVSYAVNDIFDNTTTSITAAPTKQQGTIDEDAIFALLSQVSGAALQNSTSPQYNAYQWIVNKNQVPVAAESKLLQRYALATLYFALSPALMSQGDLPSDSASSDECSWSTVVCDMNMTTGVVTEINMASQMNFDGTIPAEIGLLSSLQKLDLYNNSIQGSIPAKLWTLTNLKGLYLNNNQMTGQAMTDATGDLKELVHLYLGNNEFTGSIAATLRSSGDTSHPLRKSCIVPF